MKQILIYGLCLFFIGTALYAQKQEDVKKHRVRYGFDINRRPPVNFNIYVGYEGERWIPKVFVGVAIQNDVLQFAKSEDLFTSEYQITVAIREEENESTILTETWSESKTEANFKITNSKRTYQYHAYKLSDIYPEGEKKLDPGDYECLLEVRDLISKKSYRNKRSFNIRPIPASAEEASPSEIVFLLADRESESSIPIVPSASVLEFNRAYRAYMRFPVALNDSVQMNVRIYKTDREGSQLIYQTFVTAEPDTANIIHFYYDLPQSILEEGRYKIRLTGKTDTIRFDQEKKFRIVWFDKPIYLYKADLAIRPLKYVLPKETYEEVKDKKYSELREWLKNYWKQKDPTEGTAYNELLYEFYNRVDMANREYSTRFKEGWETDQGKVLILYGQPDQIENKRYSANTVPYIVWSYNDSNLVFTFTDSDQDGEFILQTAENGKDK